MGDTHLYRPTDLIQAFSRCICSGASIQHNYDSLSCDICVYMCTSSDKCRPAHKMPNSWWSVLRGEVNWQPEQRAVKKGSSMLGIVRKGMENKLASIVMPLYKLMYSQPHMGYCVHFWPLKKDIAKQGKAQTRTTEIIQGWNTFHMKQG